MQHTSALALYFVVFFVVIFVWRSWLVYRRTGINPVVLSRHDDAHGYVGRAFKWLMLGLALHVFALALLPTYVAPDITAYPALQWLGWGILLTALPTAGWAQHDMGAAWRIGIDEAAQPQLIQHGVYKLSRNPIFLATRMALLGLMLVSPGAVTLVFAALGEVLMQVQVRLEEAYLQRCLGQTYANYCARVPRWL